MRTVRIVRRLWLLRSGRWANQRLTIAHRFAAHTTDSTRGLRAVLAVSNTLRGGLFIICGTSLIGLIDNFVPIIAEQHGVWQFHMIRSVMAGLLVVLYCRVRGLRIWPKRLQPVFVRSVFIAISMILYFGSISLMPIAEAGAALFSSPIFILIFSLLFFGTRIGIHRTLAVGIGFAGVLLVLKPDPTHLGVITFVPMLAGLFYALSQLWTRHFCAAENTATILLGFLTMIGLFGLAGTAFLTLFPPPAAWVAMAPFFFSGWQPVTWTFLFWTAIQAVGSNIAVACLIRGYQIAEPTRVAVYEYSFLLFAGLWGWLLWGQIPDMFSLLGIALIIGAGITIVLRANRLPGEQDAPDHS